MEHEASQRAPVFAEVVRIVGFDAQGRQVEMPDDTNAILKRLLAANERATSNLQSGQEWVITDADIKAQAHEEMLDYVDMGHFKDWEFALKLLEEGYFFGFSEALRTAPTVDVEAWTAVKRTTDALAYIKGIVEWGIGHPLEDAASIENAVLNYVKSLEAPTAQWYSREQVRRAYIDGQADDATADTVEEYLATITPGVTP
jgi:hypothetical protein